MIYVTPILLLLASSGGQHLEKLANHAAQRFVVGPDEGVVHAVGFSPDGNTVAGLTNGTVQLWDRVSGKKLCQADINDNECRRPHSCVFSPDGKKLASVHDGLLPNSGRARIFLWDVRNRNRLTKVASLRCPAISHVFDAVWQVVFASDSKTLVTGDASGAIHLWNVENGQKQLCFQGGVAAAFASDDRSVISIGHDGMIYHWIARTNQRINPTKGTEPTDFIHTDAVVFAPSRRLVAISDGFTTWLKETATGRTVRRLEYPFEVVPLAFSADEQSLAVRAKNGICLMDTNTGKELAWRPGLPCAFSSDGRFFARSDGHFILLEESPISGTDGAQLPAKADPPGTTLQAELVANQDRYVLDPFGLSPTEFSTQVLFDYLPPPTVDLALKLTNTGDKPLTFRWRLAEMPIFRLVGPGAINVAYQDLPTGVWGPEEPRLIPLSPGASHTIRIVALGNPHVCYEDKSYWLLPGEYKLYADYCCWIKPAAKPDKGVGDDGFGYVRLSCSPVKIRVLPSQHPPIEPLEKPLMVPKFGSLITPVDKETVELRGLLARPARAISKEDGSTVQNVIQYISALYGIDVRINQEAFRKIGRQDIQQAKAKECSIDNVSLSMILHVMLEPLDASYEIRGKTVWIVPLDRPLSLADRLVSPYGDRSRRWLYEPLTLKPGIEKGTPLAKALQEFHERFGASFFIDDRAFERAGIKDIDKRPVQISERTHVRAGSILRELLQPVGATFVARDSTILIVPLGK